MFFLLNDRRNTEELKRNVSSISYSILARNLNVPSCFYVSMFYLFYTSKEPSMFQASMLLNYIVSYLHVDYKDSKTT